MLDALTKKFSCYSCQENKFRIFLSLPHKSKKKVAEFSYTLSLIIIQRSQSYVLLIEISPFECLEGVMFSSAKIKEERNLNNIFSLRFSFKNDFFSCFISNQCLKNWKMCQSRLRSPAFAVVFKRKKKTIKNHKMKT